MKYIYIWLKWWVSQLYITLVWALYIIDIGVSWALKPFLLQNLISEYFYVPVIAFVAQMFGF